MSPDRTQKSLLASFLISMLEPEIRAWNGVLPLGKVFWGYGVLVSSALAILCLRAIYDGRIYLQEVTQFCFAAYTVWVLIVVWRCAASARPFWGALAQWLTVAWAGNTAFIIFFLQLDTLTRYLAQ
jgi:hypothetical protein